MERDGKREGKGDGDVDRWREGGDGDRKEEKEMGWIDNFLSAQCNPEATCT